MASGERLCAAILTEWQGRAEAIPVLRADLLSALYGPAAGSRAATLLERSVRMLGGMLINRGIDSVPAPLAGLHFGPVEVAHVTTHYDLVHVAKLMSSSLAVMGDPGGVELTDEAETATQPNRQFVTRVRDLVLERRVDLAPYFNREATLLDGRRTVRFGFLSNSLAAHFGLLPATRTGSYVRNARGLLAELSIARKARGGKAALMLGHPPLTSPTLADREREAINDYVGELGLEAVEFNVAFTAADNDVAVRDALLALA